MARPNVKHPHGRSYRTGKKPARPGAVKFKLTNYINRKALPKCPAKFGHEDLIGDRDWGMLANDSVGCCVLAGAAHEHMLWTRIGEAPDASFSPEAVLSDYTAITGYNPNAPLDANGENPTDQGTDMELAAQYRRKTGIVDDKGNRHQIAAYLAVEPGNMDQLFLATWLFGAVGIGLEFPDYAMQQFDAGKPWTVKKAPRPEDGHYVPMIAKRQQLVCVTWGREQPMTAGFLHKYCDEAVCYLAPEALTNRKSAEGFDYDALLQDLKGLKPAR